MPAHRKPGVILSITGSRRARKRGAEPDTGRGIGSPPRRLSPAARATWREIVANTAPGVFLSSDRCFLELVAVLLAQAREDPASIGGRKQALLLSMLSKCGMTPADRSRVYVAPAPGTSGKRTGLDSFR